MIDLKFDSKLYKDMINGLKVQTIRDHLKDGISPGEVVNAVFVKDGEVLKDFKILIKIVSVTQKLFIDLDCADAKNENVFNPDGSGCKQYSNVELMNVLKEYYPNIKNTDIVYCIKFELATP